MGELKQYKVKDDEQVGGTTAGRIREAAAKCADVKRALVVLFPSVFEEVTPLFRRGDVLRWNSSASEKQWMYLGSDEPARKFFEAVKRVPPQKDTHIFVCVKEGGGTHIGDVAFVYASSLANAQKVTVV